MKCRLSENHILPLVSWAWPQLPAVGSLAEIPHPAPSLSGSRNPLAQPRGRRRGEGGKGGLLFLVGQEEGAEPNAGHAAAPTALRELKITMFTHSQSWDFCLPVRRGSGPRCVRITHGTSSTGAGRYLVQRRRGPGLSGFASSGCFRRREVRKAAGAESPSGGSLPLLPPGVRDTAKAGSTENVART